MVKVVVQVQVQVGFENTNIGESPVSEARHAEPDVLQDQGYYRGLPT